MCNHSIPAAGSVPVSSERANQPFEKGTGGSASFRIPALITLESGDLLAACDARWGGYGDHGGLDTIASRSSDGGRSWKTSFPLLFPDSAAFVGKGKATTIIDPVLVQGRSGDVLCLVDVNPTAITTQDVLPGIGTGFLPIEGKLRLMLTDGYDKAFTQPESEDSDYRYYVGDYGTDGFAPVLFRDTHGQTGYRVDGWFNLYREGEELTQPQVDTGKPICQNIFYRASELHVYNTGYLCIIRSKDEGRSWLPPEIISQQIKHTAPNEPAILIAPGRGLVTSDGTIVIPIYRYNLAEEGAGFIYSRDEGRTWKRSSEVSDVHSSENELVELPGGVLRMFFRNHENVLYYVDSVPEGDGYRTGASVRTDIPVCSTCKLSAVTWVVEGQLHIFISCPGGPDREAGTILTFKMEDGAMKLVNRYVLNPGFFGYSCLTVLPGGNLGLLWENDAAAIRYDEIPLEAVLP